MGLEPMDPFDRTLGQPTGGEFSFGLAAEDNRMSGYTHTANGRTWRLYGCAKRGCDRISLDYESFGAGGKGYCKSHIPLRFRVKLWWQERRAALTREDNGE